MLTGGRNIAMKVPPHQFDQTVRFYRDVIGLEPLAEHLPSIVFQFGPGLLWIDNIPTLSQAEIWLELRTGDTKAAGKHLESANVVRCDAIETLPEGFDGFWIVNPAGIVHLVHGAKEDI